MSVRFPDDFNLADYWLYDRLRDGKGDKVALRFGDRAWTYAEVAERSQALARHFTVEEMQRVNYVPEADWLALAEAGERLLREGKPPASAEAAALVRQWLGIMARLSRGDAALTAKMIASMRAEPVLAAASAVPPAVRDYLRRAHAALDPHAT